MAHCNARLRFAALLGIIMSMKTWTHCWSMAVLLTACVLPGDAGAKEPLRLKPSSKWNVHYADDSCSMGRSFGEGDQRVILVADRYEPGDLLRLSFTGKPAATNLNEGLVQVRFGPKEAVQEVDFYPATSANKMPAVILREGVRIAPHAPEELAAYDAAVKAERQDFLWSEITPEQEAAATFIEVKRSIRQPFILETGSLGPPLAALRKCTDELLGHWGIDVAKHATLSRQVTPASNPGKWVRPNDYPPAMIQQGKRAIVHFRLNVDAAGKPTACHIQKSTRPQAFDDAVCKAILRNAKFEPALDAAGNPVASYWLNTVIFHI